MKTGIVRYDINQYDDLSGKELCTLAAGSLSITIDSGLPPGSRQGGSIDARCEALLQAAAAAIRAHLDKASPPD